MHQCTHKHEHIHTNNNIKIHININIDMNTCTNTHSGAVCGRGDSSVHEWATSAQCGGSFTGVLDPAACLTAGTSVVTVTVMVMVDFCSLDGCTTVKLPSWVKFLLLVQPARTVAITCRIIFVTYL